MGKTSSKVKDRYNSKAYDSITLRCRKGQKEQYQAHAEKMGESLNSFINRAILETISRDSPNTPNTANQNPLH